MHEFDAGGPVWYACYIRLFTCLLQVVHEVQLLQEVQLYQILIQECMNFMQEDLYGMRVIQGCSHAYYRWCMRCSCYRKRSCTKVNADVPKSGAGVHVLMQEWSAYMLYVVVYMLTTGSA